MYADQTEVDLIKEYSPSHWSKKFPDPTDCINHHVQFVSSESKRVQSKYKSKLNIGYGSTERESYDIYFKDEEETSKIFVYVHGGCWQMLNKESSAYCVEPFVERGHRVIIVDYNLCPFVSLSKITEEISVCMRQIHEYGKNSGASEIIVCGHSAGAHLLTFLLGEEFDLIKQVYLISGVYDLREIWKNPAMDENDTLKLNEKDLVELSPILTRSFSEKFNPIIHILYGEHDSPSFKNQSIAYAEYLKYSGFEVSLEEFPNYDHFEIVEELSRRESRIGEYILKRL